MEAAGGNDAFQVLSDALGSGIDLSALQDLQQRAKMRQETDEERRRALGVLSMAAERETDVFEVVLGTLSRETIQPNDQEERSALLCAVRSGKAGAVVAVVERMQEEGLEHAGWLLPTFFGSDHSILQVDEVADGVLGLMPAAAFETASPYGDCMLAALSCGYCRWERALDLCLRHGPSMRERVEGPQSAGDAELYRPRLRYVTFAAALGGMEIVRKMHEMVPLLPDGSGRRGAVADYANAIECIGCEDVEYLEANEEVAIMEYLVERSGGIEVLDKCPAYSLLRTVEMLKWVALQAPYQLEKAYRLPYSLRRLIYNDREYLEFATEQISELVDREVIVAMMQQRVSGPLTKGGWRWQLEKLHKAVPESMDGLEWPWLMDAIRDKAYRDVEYLLAMCRREHLVMRNKDGDMAHNVAARDERFPRELLQRLKVAAKGAHA